MGTSCWCDYGNIMKTLKCFSLILTLLASTITRPTIQTPQKIYEATRLLPAPGTASVVTIFYKQIDAGEPLHGPSTELSFVDDTSRKELAFFAQPQTHSSIENSKIPAIQMMQRLIQQAHKKLFISRACSINFSVFFKFEDPKKALHAHVKLGKISSSPKAFSATVTIAGFTPKLPAQILNFFTAIMLDDALWEKHCGKALGIIVLASSYFLLPSKTPEKPPQRPAGDPNKKPPHIPAPASPIPPVPPAASPRRAPVDTKDPVTHYFQDYADNKYSMVYGRTDASLIERDGIPSPAELIPLELLIGRLDVDGKTMKGGLSFNGNKQAEEVHCWIQRAFPKNIPGDVNAQAPISTPATFAAFKTNPYLQEVMKNCLRYYLNFMGYNLIENDITITFEKRSDFNVRIQNIVDHPHNFSRISRIITSLHQHGLTRHSEAFRKLVAVTLPLEHPEFKKATTESIQHWRGS